MQKKDESIVILDVYWKGIVSDIQARGEHVNQLFEDANIPTLPISASSVSYTKVDESVVSLTVYLKDLLNDIQATQDHILDDGNIPILPISASDVSYEKEAKNFVQLNTYLKDLLNDIQAVGDHANQLIGELEDKLTDNGETSISDLLKEIHDVTKDVSDITENVSDTIENIAKISETIESIISSVTAAQTLAGTAEAAAAVAVGVSVTSMGTELAGEIAAAAAIDAGAVESIGILSGTIANLEIPKLLIDAIQVNYIKTDETVVALNTYLINLVSDIQTHVEDNVPTLQIAVSDVLISNGETLEDWIINNIESVTDISMDQAGYKMEELKNILDPRITALEANQFQITEDDIIFKVDEEKFDTILSRGLRTSVTDNEVIFHKPGDTITNDYSPHQLTLPFGEDFTEWDTVRNRAANVEDLE